MSYEGIKNLNIAKMFNRWFSIWVAITSILVIAMYIVGPQEETLYTLASIIMATMMLLPVRDWMYRLICWMIDFTSSINTNVKDKINQVVTYNRLIDPKTRESNPGFYRALKCAVGIISLIMALLCMIFKRTSFNLVYAFLRTWELIFRREISWLALLLNIIIWIGFGFFMWWAVGKILNATSTVLSTIATIIGIYSKILISCCLMKYTLSMTISSILFWTSLLGFSVLTFFICKIIKNVIKIRSGNNGNGSGNTGGPNGGGSGGTP